MKTLLIGALALLISLGATAQKKKKQDIEAIMAMCGCYEVKFNFAETFAPDKDYKFHDNYRSGALEYVFPVEESKDKIVLQHLLVIGDTMIIKHWRQDWLYENTELYTYDHDTRWKYTTLPDNAVKGQWTQKVYQVDDSPRYEGSASWIHVDGRHYWEATADAPLPRREFSKRSDYNVMERRNRQELLADGWVHEQDNAKVVRSAEGDEIIAYEKGWNTYIRTADEQCQLARDWWSSNELYWADVRQVWDELFAEKQDLGLDIKKGDQILFMRLFALGDELVSAPAYDAASAQSSIKEIINEHLKDNRTVASN